MKRFEASAVKKIKKLVRYDSADGKLSMRFVDHGALSDDKLTRQTGRNYGALAITTETGDKTLIVMGYQDGYYMAEVPLKRKKIGGLYAAFGVKKMPNGTGPMINFRFEF